MSFGSRIFSIIFKFLEKSSKRNLLLFHLEFFLSYDSVPNSSFSLAQNRIPNSGANATRRPAVPPLFAHFPGAAASGADEKKRKRGNAEGRGGDGLSPVVIHRRLRLASIDGRTDGHGRDTEDGFTQTRVTNNRSVRPFLLLLLFLLILFPPRFHSASPPAETQRPSGRTGR